MRRHNHHYHHHNVLLLLLFLVTGCNGALLGMTKTTSTSSSSSAHAPAPDLVKLAPRLYGNKLNYRVAIGEKTSPFQVKDLFVQLGENCQAKPKSSLQQQSAFSATGIHEATILQNPCYVNELGQQTVVLQNGGWQVQWSRKSAHGFLVCSFVPTSNYQRNDSIDSKSSSSSKSSTDDKKNEQNKYSKLDKGVRFFLYHRIWTTATLASERARRRAIQITAAKALQERDLKLQQYTTNPDMMEGDDNGNSNKMIADVTSKVTAYAQAVKSAKDYRESGIREAMYIPLHDHQVLELTPDCIVSSRGEVYKMDRRGLDYMGECRVDFMKGNNEEKQQEIATPPATTRSEE